MRPGCGGRRAPQWRGGSSRRPRGRMGGVRGMWMAAGFSLNGYGGAGGVGKLLAEWIIGGEPTMDVYAYKATRFGNYYADPRYACERTRESVKYYYRLRFPTDEFESGRA